MSNAEGDFEQATPRLDACRGRAAFATSEKKGKRRARSPAAWASSWLCTAAGQTSRYPALQKVRRLLAASFARGWLVLHESGTYVKFTQAGAELFA